jgi:hypothetical protein
MHLVTGKAAATDWQTLAHQPYDMLDCTLPFSTIGRPIGCKECDRSATPQNHDRFPSFCLPQNPGKSLIGFSGRHETHWSLGL